MSNAQELGNSASDQIGPIRLDGAAMLAPMSGVSDLAMRRIARRFGAALVFSEMVAADTYLEGDAEATLRAEGEGVSPHAVQLVGRDARRARRDGAPGRGGGRSDHRRQHGLPGPPGVGGARRARRSCAISMTPSGFSSAVVEAVSVPVTVKMRLGWDETSLNAPELARRAERAGVRMATVHGRTRAQFYSGRADWRAARAVVEAVAMPVVVNGDCAGLDDARAMLGAVGRERRHDRARRARRAVARRGGLRSADGRRARFAFPRAQEGARRRSSISTG